MNRLSSTVLAGALALCAVVPALAGPAAARPAADAPTRPGTAAGASAAVAAASTDRRRPAQATIVQVAGSVDLLSVRGAGPFRIGARLTRLSAAGLIDWTAAGCDGVVNAGVTGDWAGKILLAFRDGRLVSVGTATAPPRSPAGASVGMSFAELEEIYGRRGELISNDAGDATAYLVRFGSRVELFTGHPIRPGVGWFEAGRADFVERGFRQGHSC
ncbi:hypothetical protein GA0074696_4377 [Micromonospora purpureochromogenes]|uniref:Uncharacterized protein n=1 Tax=Micromonospora purpureochromogenes TaxID=47872 RepID=A0A1C4ZFZ0_9ACTN|nr:hypothetical protein [Micromonospora purpureochromogenes]SCF31754.1 hypothetical protein GA0074696_4377 [Micromonospora purpureochromogenes]